MHALPRGMARVALATVFGRDELGWYVLQQLLLEALAQHLDLPHGEKGGRQQLSERTRDQLA